VTKEKKKRGAREKRAEEGKFALLSLPLSLAFQKDKYTQQQQKKERKCLSFLASTERRRLYKGYIYFTLSLSISSTASTTSKKKLHKKGLKKSLQSKSRRYKDPSKP